MNARRGDPRYATTLAHGLAVLEAFDAGPAGLANKALAARVGLSPATISRLTATLQTLGLLDYDPLSRTYRPGSAALTLGYPLLVGLGVRQAARLPMKLLADELGGSVSLGMRDRTRMVCVETSRGGDARAAGPDIGAALSMTGTAMGRAWLGAVDAALRDRVLEAIRAESPAGHARRLAAVDAARGDLARLGCCVSYGDSERGVHAVAVPLAGEVDGERLVVDCSLAAQRPGAGELADRIAPRLLALARRIEDDWHAGPHGAPALPPP